MAVAADEVGFVADENRDDVFEVMTTMKINNPCLGLDVTIHPCFIKLMDDGSRFVSLDFYRSRGVYALLSSRLPRKAGRHYGKVLAKVVGDLKRQRDAAFRQSLLADAGAPAHVKRARCRGPLSVKPRNRVLMAIAMGKSEVLQIEVDAFIHEFEGYCLSCFVCMERHNGNTEMWVDAQSSTWNYLSKLVAHEYRNSLQGEGEAHATDNSANTA